MKKGFTLIELLAVILILGIIALIAVPQVTNVIDKARKGAAETSAEHYVGAVNNKVALNKLDTDSSNDIETAVKDVSELEVDITGETPTSGKVYIEKGTVKQAEIVVNGYDVTCDEKGKCEAVKDYRYYANDSYDSTIIMTVENLLSARPTEVKVYLKYAVVNNELGIPQVCMYENNKELCLRENYYEISKNKMLEYYEYDKNTWHQDSVKPSLWHKNLGNNSIYCSIDMHNNDEIYTECGTQAASMVTYTDGSVFSYDFDNSHHGFGCEIDSGLAECYYW